jgi:hypothetical protein
MLIAKLAVLQPQSLLQFSKQCVWRNLSLTYKWV